MYFISHTLYYSMFFSKLVNLMSWSKLSFWISDQCSFCNKNYLFSVSLKHLLPLNLCVHLISGVCVSELEVVPCSESHCVRKLCLHKLTLYWCLQLLRTSTSKDSPQSCCQTYVHVILQRLPWAMHAHISYTYTYCESFVSEMAHFNTLYVKKRQWYEKHSVLQSGYFNPDIITSTMR